MLTQKEKELIAVGASVASGCEPCTAHHVKAAREAGASDAELRGAVDAALEVRGRATGRMAGVAARELGRAAPMPGCSGLEGLSRVEALVCAAAALAANCGAGVPGFLAAAARSGATERQAQVALGTARQIKKVAAEKAEAEASGDQERKPSQACGCGGVTSPSACGS
ncbi:MAG: carboxymuconolactone decarboxylase family protein [Deltaproteobacteria bacterium]|nr:carboxymuconolactone decarboxylase family protein [Deltaproteobacteria bacterium]